MYIYLDPPRPVPFVSPHPRLSASKYDAHFSTKDVQGDAAAGALPPATQTRSIRMCVRRRAFVRLCVKSGVCLNAFVPQRALSTFRVPPLSSSELCLPPSSTEWSFSLPSPCLLRSTCLPLLLWGGKNAAHLRRPLSALLLQSFPLPSPCLFPSSRSPLAGAGNMRLSSGSRILSCLVATCSW